MCALKTSDLPDVVHAAAVQLEIGYLDADSNTAAALDAIARAADDGAELVVLPELVDLGYPRTSSAEDQQEYREAARASAGVLPGALARVARERGVVVVAGFAQADARGTGVLTNNVGAFLPDGRAYVTAKIHLPKHERPYFRPGSSIEGCDTPLGRLGPMICADNSFPETARALALDGADILTVSYLAPVMPNPESYPSLCVTRAFENQCFVVAAQACGTQGEFTLTARSCIAGPDGTMLARCEPDIPGICHAELDRAVLLHTRSWLPRLPSRRPELYAPLTEH